ncbi:MAG TPA: HEAT repeat domain-containing protein [Terriglobales bacterium]|nr:HEAT repeat domain-containing protein [Terriglobales bacterium]
MSTRTRILFFMTAWAIVLMPFLFWRSTWFGRQLSDAELNRYLHDSQKPRHIQHALVQIGERIGRRDDSVAHWYPDLVWLASHPVEEIRNTDAWVMGQDASRPEFHQALLELLHDSSANVRGNAALALVRFGDDSGRSQLLEMLKPAVITAPSTGIIVDSAKPGTTVRQNGTVSKLSADAKIFELRSPLTGRVAFAASRGAQVAANGEIARIDPSTDQVWEALRALYVVGRVEDLPAIRPYERALPEMPERIREQAVASERAILQRAAK